jgi:hypothetical protein
MGRRAVGRFLAGVAEGRRRRAWLLAHRGQPLDVVVSHAEVNDRHGTGVLTQRLFPDTSALASIRSRNDYDGRQRFGAFSARLPQPDPAKAHARLRALLRGAKVRRVLAIPFYPDDVRTALALRELFGAPLCTFVMDDRNLETDGIPDALLMELLERSALRLAVSPEIRDGYQRKFGHPFVFVSPVVDPKLVLRAPAKGVPEPGGRGVMIGNVWGKAWLAGLAELTRGSGVELDWYSNAGLDWQDLGPEELARAGIHWRRGPPDVELVPLLRRAPFAVLPSGTLDEGEDHRAIARLSLPSKAVYTTATAHLPLLVVGHPETAAARFATRLGVGFSVPYHRAAFLDAVERLRRPEVQARLRARALAAAPAFSAEGVGDWIWRSLSAGAPVDDRFERLLVGAA